MQLLNIVMICVIINFIRISILSCMYRYFGIVLFVYPTNLLSEFEVQSEPEVLICASHPQFSQFVYFILSLAVSELPGYTGR